MFIALLGAGKDFFFASALSIATIACEREQIAYSSLLRRRETAHADPKAMQARLIRGRLA